MFVRLFFFPVVPCRKIGISHHDGLFNTKHEVSRVVDLSTSALAGLMRCFSGGWIAGGAEKRQRPSKPIMLFEHLG